MKKLLIMSLILVTAGAANAAMYNNRHLNRRTLNNLCKSSFNETYYYSGDGACASDTGLAFNRNRNLSKYTLSNTCRKSFGDSYNYIGNGTCGSDIG